ncbi:MAG TPA: L-threonylcarbamoyladenylate synthase [Acidimicrobiales bacterium]|nr:L-threonylcarbamoyladenylate synthase [Acidimicrobiales bacterium]
MLLDASGDSPDPDVVGRAVEALKAGQPIVVPTDTVYGIAADPRQTGSLFAIKGRPREVALPVLIGDVDQATALAADGLPPAVHQLMDRWWPGALTVVVPRRGGLGLDLGGPDDATIGLRLPGHPVPVALAARFGPLAVTSANRHGEVTPVTALEVIAQLGDGVAVVLDGGPCGGAASTVVSCVDGELRVLREGAIPSSRVLEKHTQAPGPPR